MGQSERIRDGDGGSANSLARRASSRNARDASNHHSSCGLDDLRPPALSEKCRRPNRALQLLELTFSYSLRRRKFGIWICLRHRQGKSPSVLSPPTRRHAPPVTIAKIGLYLSDEAIVP